MKKEQFNTRIPETLKRATATVSSALGWTREEVTEVALATLLGSRDKLILAKREKIQEKAKEMALSFEEALLQRQGQDQLELLAA